MKKPPSHFPDPRKQRPTSRRFGTLRALMPFLRPYWALLLWAIVVLIVTSLVALLLPFVVRALIDRFDFNDFAQLDRYFLLALGGVAVIAVGSALRFYLLARLGEQVVVDLRKAVFNRVIGMSPTFFEAILSGEVLSRITTDTTLVQSVVGNSLATALRSLLTLAGGLALMFVTSVKLAAIVLLVVPFLALPVMFLGRRMRRLSREAQAWIAASSGKASESLTSVQTVQSFTFEAASQAEFAEYTEGSLEAAKRRVELRAFLMLIAIFLSFASVVGMLWVGARDVSVGVMTPGTLAQFMIYATMVARSVTGLAQLWTELQRAAGATDRLFELLHAEDDVTDPASPQTLPQPAKGRIAFEDVRFCYPKRPGDPALNGVSFTIEPGETVALVGPSGAGKTTIIQLIQRFYDPLEGRVTLDGCDLRALARTDFRSAIALVPQDPAIFAASALDNIRFGRPDATKDEIEAAARAAAAHTFITGFPKGYETYLGERGVMLSGGQKQRVAIARAILRDAPILLLDEATSALDAESEGAVQQAVDQLSRDRTTIIIAHRLATVKKADRIIVLDQGRITATGTHESLMAEDGLYARLARLQFIT